MIIVVKCSASTYYWKVYNRQRLDFRHVLSNSQIHFLICYDMWQTNIFLDFVVLDYIQITLGFIILLSSFDSSPFTGKITDLHQLKSSSDGYVLFKLSVCICSILKSPIIFQFTALVLILFWFETQRNPLFIYTWLCLLKQQFSFFFWVSCVHFFLLTIFCICCL